MQTKFTEAECEQYANHIIKKFLKTEWTFLWSNKMTKAFGYCYSNKTIKISRHYFHLNKAFPHIIRNVILHEVAHAMQFEDMGYLSHDYHWKGYCLRIGADPKARFSEKFVTCPSERFALRNTFNGTVIEYMTITNKSPDTISGVLKEFEERIKQEEEETNTKLSYELVWCGK